LRSLAVHLFIFFSEKDSIMFTSITTAAYVRSPLESSDFDGFAGMPTVPAFKPLTERQYEAWAGGHVTVDTCRLFHELTGKAPTFSHGRPVGAIQLEAMLALEGYTTTGDAIDVCKANAETLPSGCVAQMLAQINQAAHEAAARVYREWFHAEAGMWLAE